MDGPAPAAEEPAPARRWTARILGDGAGSVVRLYVDEPGEPPADLGTESAWLRIVARLESALAGTGAAQRRL